MSDLDGALIGYVLREPSAFNEFRRSGITADDFVGDYRKVWNFLCRAKRDHGQVPSKSVVSRRYPELEFHKPRERDLPLITADIKKRRKYLDFLTALDESSRLASSPDDLDLALGTLQSKINDLSMRNGSSPVVDLFSPEIRKRMMREIKRRRSGQAIGLPTGFKRLDYVTGGLQPSKMVVVMARPSVGKSWISLILMAQAVMSGAKVILYPLEMTLEETAFRLYTIFSHKMFGQRKVLKNIDLSLGRISPSKVRKILNILEDRFAGQLWVADVANLSDPYTMDRIGAEVDMHKPDMFWIDLLTLVRPPDSTEPESAQAIAALARATKNISMTNKCVGGVSAQVNREALKVKAFLPRLEHIMYGDAIGQYADLVISLNRRREYLYYAATKHRGGPEVSKTRLTFFANEGNIQETEHQDDVDDDEA